jgi:undecaprenyl-diphosphatase
VAAVSVAGFLVLTIVMVAIGRVITSSFLSASIGSSDASLGQWFEVHRSALLNGWTNVGSILAGTGTILLVAGISAGILLFRRLWYEAAFLAIGLSIEFTVFLATTTLVDRPRPAVVPLDPLPVTSSFPSGHVAAAIVLYIGLAMLVSSHTHRMAVRIPVWIVVAILPIWVGLSRVYRGMHHPSDAIASIVLGVGALSFTLLAVRAGAVVANHRRLGRIATPTRPETSTVRA